MTSATSFVTRLRIILTHGQTCVSTLINIWIFEPFFTVKTFFCVHETRFVNVYPALTLCNGEDPEGTPDFDHRNFLANNANPPNISPTSASPELDDARPGSFVGVVGTGCGSFKSHGATCCAASFG